MHIWRVVLNTAVPMEQTCGLNLSFLFCTFLIVFKPISYSLMTNRLRAQVLYEVEFNYVLNNSRERRPVHSRNGHETKI